MNPLINISTALVSSLSRSCSTLRLRSLSLSSLSLRSLGFRALGLGLERSSVLGVHSIRSTFV